MAQSEEISKLVFNDDLTGLYNRRWMFKYLADRLGGTSAPPATQRSVPPGPQPAARSAPEYASLATASGTPPHGVKNHGHDAHATDDAKDHGHDAHATPSEPLSLLMMDLDGFKTINDTRGHVEGDRALVRFAEILKEEFPEKHFLVRYAGDEFSVLMPQTGKSEAAVLAEQFRKKVEAENPCATTGYSPLRTTVSIGLAAFPEDAADAETLLEKVDKALYFSKQSGKNRVTDVATIGGEIVFAQDLMKRFPCTRLIGREMILDDIAAIVEACRGGHNIFALMRGEPGVGKTRLLGELVRLADKQDFICLLERCAPEDTDTPYGPLMSLLNRYLTGAPAELQRLSVRLFDEYLVALKESVPAFRSVQSRRQVTPQPPEKQRQLLFEALVNLLCCISESKPIAILFDEFQHIDPATLEIAKQVLSLTRGRVLICGAVATTDENEKRLQEGSIADFWKSVRSTEQFRLVNIEPLTIEHVGLMVTAIFPDRQDFPAFDTILHALSHGNPLYIEEILKSLIGNGLIARHAGAWKFPDPADVPAPLSLKHAIDARLEALDEETRRVVTEAAVIGPHFDMDVLRAIEGRNESETLELVDKAKMKGIILYAAPLSDDELRFASEQVRKVTYETTDDRLRTQLHGKIGAAEEKLHKGELPRVAGRLAYHFRLANEQEKTAQYEQLARDESEKLFRQQEAPKYHERQRSILRSLIREADKPLDDAATALVGTLLRNLTTAVKNIRMYPAGSHLILAAMERLGSSLQSVLAKAESLTFSAGKDALSINTVPMRGKEHDAAADEMLELLKSHFLKSITFTREHSEAELEAVVKGLSVSADKGSSDPDYWNRFLDEHAVSNVAANQKAYYVAEEKDTARTRRYTKTVELPLDQQSMLLMRDVLRYFCATVENIRMYPQGSQLVTFALDLLVKSLSEISRHVYLFTFSEVDDALLINGILANPQILGNRVVDFVRILKEHKIRSCTLAAGVSREELEIFLGRLAQAASDETASMDFWDKLFEERGLTHIAVGNKLYAMVESAGRREAARREPTVLESPREKPAAAAEPEKKPQEERRAAAAAPEIEPQEGKRAALAADEKKMEAETEAALPPVARASEEALKRAQQKTAAAFEELLTDESQRTTLNLIETLVLDGQMQPAGALVEKIAQGILHPQTKIRMGCAEFLAAVLDKASPAARSVLIDRTGGWLVDALRVEENLPTYEKLAELARRLVAELFEKPALAAADRLVWAMLKQRESAGTLGKEFKDAGTEILRKISESAGMDNVFASLVSVDAKLRKSAANVVAGLGAPIAGRLARLIKESEDMSLRRFAASVLREVAPESARELVKELAPFAPPGDSRRIASVLDQLSRSVELDVSAALRHSDESVRKEGLNIIRRLDLEKAMHVMMQALDEDDPNIVLSAVAYFGEQKAKVAVDELIRLVEKNKNKDVRKEACLALGKIGDEKAISLLGRIVDYRPGATRIFGLGGTYSEEIRAAAAWALGSFPGNAVVKEILERAAQDKSEMVRSAAKLALR